MKTAVVILNCMYSCQLIIWGPNSISLGALFRSLVHTSGLDAYLRSVVYTSRIKQTEPIAPKFLRPVKREPDSGVSLQYVISMRM